MRVLSDRGRIQFLLAIMAVVAVITAAMSLWLLYQTALGEERSRLVETAQSQARLIEAVARFDAVYSRTDFPGGADAATLSQITDAHEKYRGFGETGEFTLARREHDNIIFLLSHRHYDLDTPIPVPWASSLAEPMRRALSGQSGTVIGLDYRGVLVLAAYEPVTELDLGIVAKIDMAEIRRPFLRAAGSSGLGVLLIIGLGVIAGRRIGTPMVERLRAEEALKASETQLRLVIDNLPALIVYIDADQRFRLVNRTCAAWFGRPAAEILGKRTAEIHGESYALFKPHFDAVLSGEAHTFEAEAVYPDGERRDIRSVLVPHVDPQDTVRGYFALTQDITQSKQAEKELRESEERFRDFAKTASDWFWETDMEQRFTYYTGVVPGVDLSGWNNPPGSSESVIGRTRSELWGELQDRDSDALHTIADYMARGAAFSHLELSHRDPESGLVHISLSGKPVTDDGGNVVAYRGVGHDITERKRAEEALRTSEQRFRVALGGSPIVVSTTDCDLRYTWIYNPVPGFTPEFLVGKRDDEIGLQPEEAAALIKFKHRVLESGVGAREEFSLRLPEGDATFDIVAEPLRGRGGAIIGLTVAATDITERKQVESGHRFQASIIETMMEGVVLVQLDNAKIVHANPKYEAMFGYGPGEMNGKHGSILNAGTDDEKRETARVIMAEINETGGWRGEVQNIKKDGTKFWCYATVKIMDHPEYGPVAVSIHTDITERKRAEVALLASEQRFRDVADVASDWIWETDADLRCSYFSEQMEKMTGLSARGLLGRTWSALPWVDANVPGRDRLAENFNRRKSFRDIEIAVKLPGGRLCYMRIGGKPVFDDQGNFEGYRGTGTDITAQVEAEAEMARQTALFEGIIENAVEGIYRVTADGRYVSVNPALSKMHGYDSPEEFLENCPNRTDAYDRREAWEEIARLMREEGSARGFECNAKRRGGSRFWMSESGRAVRDENGLVIGYEGFVEDITERKHVEEELRQAQKMEALGRLTGNIAHEFNNQLLAISGFTRMLQRAGIARDEEKGWLENIITATDHAASLSRGLLAFTRKQDLAPEVISVKNVLEESKVLIQPMVGGAITAQYILCDEPTLVIVDAGQFSQALLNLAINACDAMSEGGTLTIESRVVEPDSALLAGPDQMSPSPHVAISIADTGTGIDKDILERIFEPFFTTKEASKGTGLGLSIVYSMVQRSGGVIAVDSEVGAGTTFTIYLPLVKEEQTSTKAIATSDVVPTGKETILVAEDEPLIQNLVQITLEENGYKVLVSDGGQAAYETFHNHDGRVDLLVTDIKMPGMTGRELARALVAEYPNLKVLYMTGYDSEIEAGGDSDPEDDEMLLHKPFDSRDLGRAVRDVLDT